MPLFPRSEVVICSDALPVNPLVGAKLMPFSAALMLAMLPVKVIAALPLLPLAKNKPVVPARVSVPLLAVNVTSTVPGPASTSLIEIRLPFADEKTSATFLPVLCVAGTALTGASLTAVIEVDRLAVAAAMAVLPPLLAVLTLTRVSLPAAVEKPAT